MLETIELVKKYNHGATALKQLNLEISPGKIVCLAGPNGSGKTTTLRLLASLIRPSSGSIRFDNVTLVFNDLKYKTIVGYLPEKCGFYNRFSGRWNLNFYASLYKKRLVEKDLADYIKLLNFEKYLDKPVGIYSSGTKQKLGILRTLSIGPTIFLFDEPLNGLDIESQQAVKQIFKKLGEEKKIILISTHLISTIEDILDKIVILFEGIKIVDMEMMVIRNIASNEQQFRSITDFYLTKINEAKHEIK